MQAAIGYLRVSTREQGCSVENGLWANFTLTLFQAGLFGYVAQWTYESPPE